MKDFETGLSHEYLISILHYEKSTGVFTYTTDVGSRKKGALAGSFKKNGYLQIKINRFIYAGHRLAYFYVTSEWPKNDLDHIDRNRSNNSWCNLREATRSQNCRNRTKPSNNSSGHMGVSLVKKTGHWTALIRVNDKRICLGSYKQIEDAIKARKEAELKYFGEFAP